jgi:asparagine synthetase B (glutamine-hydrolysing)
VIRPDAALLTSIGIDPSSVSGEKDGASREGGEEAKDYSSPARVLIIGSGADEQFGGRSNMFGLMTA